MSKVIVIKNCWQCMYTYQHYLGLGGEIIWLCSKKDRECPNNDVPDWCPLPDLPKRFDDPAGFEELQNIYGAKGWNDCLDAITGEGEV